MSLIPVLRGLGARTGAHELLFKHVDAERAAWLGGLSEKGAEKTHGHAAARAIAGGRDERP